MVNLDPSLLEAIFPSLLVFSGISVTILLGLPVFKFEVKKKFDDLYSGDSIRPFDLWVSDFYFRISNALLFYSILYLIASLLILVSPILDAQTILSSFGVSIQLVPFSYFAIVIITIGLIISIIRAMLDSFMKARYTSKIRLISQR